MSNRKPGLTRRQHVEMGDQLLTIHTALTAIVRPILVGYPNASKPGRYALKALGELEHLRALMDSVSAQELNGDDWSPTIYYGANREVRVKWLAANPLDDEQGGA